MLLKYISTSGQNRNAISRALLLTLAAVASTAFSTPVAATINTTAHFPATTAAAPAADLAVAGTTARYANETPIQFVAGNGDSIAAFSGFFLVMENRQHANSRLLKLHYVRFPAQTKQPGSPVVYLAGGPVQSLTNTTNQALKMPLGGKMSYRDRSVFKQNFV